MSKITIRQEKGSQKEWDTLEQELKDPSLWQEAKSEIQSEFQQAKESLIKKRGRPKNEEETHGIFIKLPLSLISEIKEEAKENHLGYQSLIKMILSKHIRTEKEKKSA